MTIRDWLNTAGLACLLLAVAACGGGSVDGGGGGGGQQPPPTADTKPDDFAFTALDNLFPGMLVTSEAVMIKGIDTAAPISVSEGTEYSINGGTFTSGTGEINVNDTVRVRITTSSTAETSTEGHLEIGGVKGGFKVSTGPAINVADVDPEPFQIREPVATVEKGQTYVSEPFTVESINAPAPVSVSGGQYRIEDAEFTSTDNVVSPGQRVQVRGKAPEGDGEVSVVTLDIGGVTESFVLATPAAEGQADTVPDFFVLDSQDAANAEPNTLVVSDPVTIRGLSAGASISIVGGEYSLSGGAEETFTDQPGEVTDGSSVIVRARSAASSGGVSVARVDIGGVPGYFTVVTREIPFGSDMAPDSDSFIFGSVETENLGATVESEWKLPLSFDAPAPVSVEGGEYQLAGSVFTAEPRLILPGQMIRLRGKAPDANGENHTVTVTIGGVSRTFTIFTVASNPANNPPLAALTVPNGVPMGDGLYEVQLGENVTLDATSSTDDDPGDELSFSWIEIAGNPPGVGIVDASTPGLLVLSVTTSDTYSFAVEVSDETDSSTAAVTVDVVEPIPPGPIANAGPDQTVHVAAGAASAEVTLDGSGSENAASYEWFLNPGGSGAGSITFDNRTSSTPRVTFTNSNSGFGILGTYNFRLLVRNEAGDLFDEDFVAITIGEANTP